MILKKKFIKKRRNTLFYLIYLEKIFQKINFYCLSATKKNKMTSNN